MKRLLLITICIFSLNVLLLPTSLAQEATAPALAIPPNITNIHEVRLIRLEQPTITWRNGNQVELQDALVLEVKVIDLFDFFPRNISPPLFLYGDTVCVVLKDPWETPDGEFVLLTPRPNSNETKALWLSPSGILPEELNPDNTQAYLNQVTTGNPIRYFPIATSRLEKQPSVYPNLMELRQDIWGNES